MNKIKELLKANADSIIKPTVVLLVICIVISMALAGANLITEPKIAALDKQTLNETMKKVIKADDYIENNAEIDGEKVIYYTAKTDGKVNGFIFTFASKGYGGDINVMTAVDTEGKVVSVDILDASGETPGLGQNVTKSEFRERYVGKAGQMTTAKESSDDSEIQAWTGATISSRAVTSSVNRALEVFKTIQNGGEAE